MQELKLCGLLFGGYPTLAKSLEGMFEPQKGYFRNCCTTHSQSWNNQSESPSLIFCSLCGSHFGIPKCGLSLFKAPVSREYDVSLFLPDCNQGEATTDVCFWVYRLGALLFFTLTSTHFLELGLDSVEANSCWVRRLKLNPLNSAPTSF